MKSQKPLLKQFLEYIKRPTVDVPKKPEFSKIFFNVVRLWSVIFLASMFAAFVANLLLAEYGYTEDDFAITQVVADFPYLLIFLLVVVWAPISEEIAFRLWLRFSPLNWGLGFGFLGIFALSFFNIPFVPENFFTLDSGMGIVSMISFVFLTMVFVKWILSFEKIALRSKKFFKRNFKFFFYISAVAFAALHIENYDVDLKTVWFFVPILVLPQFLLSLGISFVRMKYGFSWAIFTHALNNVVAITPALFLLPLFKREISSFENLDFLEAFSMYEIFLVFAVFSFLMVVFLVCFLSLTSLILEFTKKQNSV